MKPWRTPMAVAALLANLALPASAEIQNPGTIDTTFNPVLGTSWASTVQSVAIQPDGRIFIVGDFTTVNGTAANYIARLTPGGALDTSFMCSPGASSTPRVIYPLNDGKVLVGGDFQTINGAAWRGVARLNSDGTPDNSFSQFSGVKGNAYALAVQSDGKILVGGSFSEVNGTPKSWLARLTASGALDTSFNPLLDGAVMSLVVRSNGKILVGGAFENANNANRRYLIQLNSDGTTDSGFNTTLDGQVNAIVVQTNGQAVIGGWFNWVNNVRHDYVARLTLNGSPDSTFTAGASGIVYSLALQPNGKILVGGGFAYMNGAAKKNLALLHSTGLLDDNFNTGVGPNLTVRSIALQADGKIVLGGDFSTVSMQPRTYTARIWGETPPPPVPADQVAIWTAVEIGWMSKANVSYIVQWSNELNPTVWQNLGPAMPGTGAQMTVFDSTRSNGKRFYRVIESN